jgi:hypothetical protein
MGGDHITVLSLAFTPRLRGLCNATREPFHLRCVYLGCSTFTLALYAVGSWMSVFTTHKDVLWVKTRHSALFSEVMLFTIFFTANLRLGPVPLDTQMV